MLCCSHAESYSVYRWVTTFWVVGVVGLQSGGQRPVVPVPFSRSVHGRDVA